MSKTEGLLQWCKSCTDGYEGVSVKNFSTSWKDGKAFCALVHHFRPDLIDFELCKNQTAEQNLEMAFAAAEKAGAARMMDVEDFDCEVPDKLSIITTIGVMQQSLDKLPTMDETTHNGLFEPTALSTNTIAPSSAKQPPTPVVSNSAKTSSSETHRRAFVYKRRAHQ